MGIRDKNGNLKGKVGLLTYRIVNNQNVVQSRPGAGQTRMHPASLMGSREFSLASNRARFIRLVLQPLLQSWYDGRMVNRLTSAVLRAIKSNELLSPGERDLPQGDLQGLRGFEFNLQSPLTSFWRQPLLPEPSAQGLRLQIPGFHPEHGISFPQGASACTLKVLLSALDLENGRYCHCEMKSLTIPLGATEVLQRDWHFTENLPEKGLFLLTAALEFSANGLTERLSLSSAQLNPVTLLGLYLLPAIGAPLQPPAPERTWGTWFPLPGAKETTLT